jgi:hypothetical protein
MRGKIIIWRRISNIYIRWTRLHVFWYTAEKKITFTEEIINRTVKNKSNYGIKHFYFLFVWSDYLWSVTVEVLDIRKKNLSGKDKLKLDS